MCSSKCCEDHPSASNTQTTISLGLAPLNAQTTPRIARLLKRLQKVEDLPPADQRAVLKLVDALVETRRRNGR